MMLTPLVSKTAKNLFNFGMVHPYYHSMTCAVCLQHIEERINLKDDTGGYCSRKLKNGQLAPIHYSCKGKRSKITGFEKTS